MRAILLILAGCLLLGACGREGAVVTEPATPTPYVAPTLQPVASESPAESESPSPTPTETASAEPTATSEGTVTVFTPSPTASAAATAKPRSTSNPPDAFVRSKQREDEGRLASYCWTSATTVCKHAESPHGKPQSGLRIERGERVILRYTIDATPSSVRVEFRQNSETKETVTPQSRNPTVVGTHAEPGLYWLVVSANWGQGVTTHVFAVDVR